MATLTLMAAQLGRKPGTLAHVSYFAADNSFKKSFEGTHWEHREHTGYIHTGNTTNSGDHRGDTLETY